MDQQRTTEAPRTSDLPARRRRFLVRFALGAMAVVAVAGVAWWGTHRDNAPSPAAVSSLLLNKPVAVAEGVYLLGRLSPAAAYAVDTSEGLVLIDSGGESSAAALKAQLDELHLDVSRLRAVLLTHAHADHSAGAAHLRSRTGAKVYAGRGDCQVLRAGGPREALVSTFNMPDFVPHPTTVDVELAGDETITFGESQFKVIAAPGHSTGSVCYLLERPGLRALFAGDVVNSLTTGSGTRGLGTYIAYLPPVYRGSARDFLTTLQHLRAMPPPDMVLPGHPWRDRIPQSPRLKPQRWQALLDGGIAEMERLVARYNTDGANFLDGTPKQLLPGLHYLGDLARLPVYCLSTPKGLFLFDAPAGKPLLDLLAERLKGTGGEDRKLTAVLLTSAGDESMAGLPELVRQTGCRVVAPRAGLKKIKALCPAGTPLLTEADLEKQGWFDVKTIALEGRGVAPVAYSIYHAGKSVLVSGRIPIKPSTTAVEQLVREAERSGGIAAYRRSLARLADVKPDLWLPALPVHGQNANLYGRDWATILAQNEVMGVAP